MNEIIDVHSHILPEELIQNRDWGIQVEEEEEGHFRVQAWGIKVDAIQKNLFSQALQAKEMKAQGLDKKVISLPPFLFGYGKDTGWAKEWTRESNDAVARICRKYSDQFVGMGIVPLQDPKAAAEEMKRCREKLGFPGIEISTHVNGQDLDQQQFSDFFGEADHLQASILVHPGNVLAGERLSKFYLRNLVGNPMETTICASRLLLSGFFERFPRLKVCFSHGGGAFPFILGRIRHGSSVRPEISHLKGRLEIPSGMYFDTIVHDPQALHLLLARCGLEAVVLGTDYPFDMAEAAPVSFIQKTVSPEAQSAILTKNPKRFLK